MNDEEKLYLLDEVVTKNGRRGKVIEFDVMQGERMVVIFTPPSIFMPKGQELLVPRADVRKIKSLDIVHV